MRKIYVLVVVLLGFMHKLYAQEDPSKRLPLQTFTPTAADTAQSLVVYLSGDGGYNSFSKQFVQEFQKRGYSIVMLNSLKYFWTKKTPEQSSADVQAVIQYYLQAWKKHKIILVGYSFGADVMPFIYNRLAENYVDKVTRVALVSVSTKTDFEVHVKQLLSSPQKTGYSTLPEINKINKTPLLLLQGESESDTLNTKDLSIKNYKKLTLPGGHHYDNNVDDVVAAILQKW